MHRICSHQIIRRRCTTNTLSAPVWCVSPPPHPCVGSCASRGSMASAARPPVPTSASASRGAACGSCSVQQQGSVRRALQRPSRQQRRYRAPTCKGSCALRLLQAAGCRLDPSSPSCRRLAAAASSSRPALGVVRGLLCRPGGATGHRNRLCSSYSVVMRHHQPPRPGTPPPAVAPACGRRTR